MEKYLAESIGAAARKARTQLALTQDDAAERIGVSGEFYARIERGNALPSVQTLARMASSLGVGADELIGRGGPRRGEPAAGWRAEPPSDAPEIRRLLRRLRRAAPETLRLVAVMLKELDTRR